MVTIEGLREGSQVPGYQGYCPGIKYRIGQRYGQDTYELSQEYTHKHSTPGVGSSAYHAKPDYSERLPEATGDNKYTRNMVPGYTGYIPRMNFKFGGTYKGDCEVSINEHLIGYEKQAERQRDLKLTSQAFPRLEAVKFDPNVRDHLNTYGENYPGRTTMIDDRKALTEPPIPGYTGFVPRIYNTELGLGCRYHEMTKNGLSSFKRETNFHASLKKQPITLDQMSDGQSFNRRLYPNDGMIPKYTGYIPQRRYNFGRTYGETTRSMEVCAHEKSSFGEYMKGKDLALSIV